MPQGTFPVVIVIGECSCGVQGSPFCYNPFHMAFRQDFFSFQRQQLFAQESAVCGSLLQVHFILAVFDQKNSHFQNASGKVGLTATVFLTLLNSFSAFEAVTHCAQEVQYFCLPSLFWPFPICPTTQLAECHIRCPEECEFYFEPFPSLRDRTGLSNKIHWDVL